MGGSPAIHLHVNNAFEKAPATIQKLDQLANNQSNRLSLSLSVPSMHSGENSLEKKTIQFCCL